jgi:hypothetical protein
MMTDRVDDGVVADNPNDDPVVAAVEAVVAVEVDDWRHLHRK